jgi:WXG100 family type VII secretion target
MTLKVTPEQVRNSASTIENLKNSMESLMQSMNTAVNGLQQDGWESGSGRDYAAQYQAVQRECTNALNAMIAKIRNLREAAAEYDNIEQAQQQKVSSLSTGNIFPG